MTDLNNLTTKQLRELYHDARTPAVLAGLEHVRRSGGSMAALPAPGAGYGPQPCKIANLVAWSHLRGSHAVQAEFDHYGRVSDALAKAATTAGHDERALRVQAREACWRASQDGTQLTLTAEQADALWQSMLTDSVTALKLSDALAVRCATLADGQAALRKVRAGLSDKQLDLAARLLDEAGQR